MCRILLSINPEHVEHIFDGTKQYEFRKTRCKEDIEGVVIYSTAPVMQVVAEADVETILEDSPNKIWKITRNKSGISKEFFFKYYSGRAKAVAYKLTNLKVFETPKELADYGVSTPPQSFVYVH